MSARARLGATPSKSVARLLANGKKTAMLLRGAALIGEGLEAAGRIQAKTGARLVCDTFAPHAELGAGRVPVERIPYFAEQIAAIPGGEPSNSILVGAKPPVSFFAYPGKPSWCVPEACEFDLSRASARGRRPGPAGSGRRARRAADDRRCASRCSCQTCRPAR